VEGVALGMKPPQYLKPGDVVEFNVGGVGKPKQKAVAYRANETAMKSGCS
jgi:2-keto-4-pentenoate hydratase/2-oxohepta-3-ene-1,7-dioic acid hydratase in catechol pathway